MRRAALLIGVDRTGGLTPLHSAAAGARRIADWLQKDWFPDGQTNSANSSIICLTDGNGKSVTISEVSTALKTLVTNPPRYDLLLVYFSGHGLWQARSDVWLLSGAPVAPTEAVNLNASMDLAKYSGIPNVVFVSDACRSLPDSRSGAFVTGEQIFPNYPQIVKASKIDFFKATSEAQSAFEGKISGEMQSLLTAALRAAYREPEPQMILTLADGAKTLEVVPNRRLEGFLQRKVNALLDSIESMQPQEIEVNVPSDETVYIAHVEPSGATEEAVAVKSLKRATSLSNLGSVAADAVRDVLATRGLHGELDELLTPLEDDAESGVKARTLAISPDHMESETGFVIRGVIVGRVVLSVVEHPLSAELLTNGRDDGVALVRVRSMLGARPRVPQGTVSSIGVEFDDGRSTVFAALPGYIGHVLVDDRGVANVNYVPSGQNPRWEQYATRKAKIDRLRAMVALAIDGERFRIRSPSEGAALAARIRMSKGEDPTLGLYAAYAFSQAGDEVNVVDVMRFMRLDLGADLFDVRLLASRQLDALGPKPPVVPFCPMLTQTWSLLASRNVERASELQRLIPHLRNSLWTTFAAGAADEVFRLI